MSLYHHCGNENDLPIWHMDAVRILPDTGYFALLHDDDDGRVVATTTSNPLTRRVVNSYRFLSCS